MLEVPDNFLGLDDQYSNFTDSAVLVLPIPYEATVSYGGGTANGPDAIITASQQVELYDREFETEPALNWGVHTLDPVDLNATPPDEAMVLIAQAVAETAQSGKLLCVLGGEHSITPPIVAAMAASSL